MNEVSKRWAEIKRLEFEDHRVHQIYIGKKYLFSFVVGENGEPNIYKTDDL